MGKVKKQLQNTFIVCQWVILNAYVFICLLVQTLLVLLLTLAKPTQIKRTFQEVEGVTNLHTTFKQFSKLRTLKEYLY